MSLVKASVSGCVVGLIGAATWAGIAHFLNLEASIVAIGIGWAIGFAIGTVAAEAASILTGILAVAITALAIAGGKWAYIEMGVAKELANASFEFQESDAIAVIATDIAEERERAGEYLDWPIGRDNDSAWAPDEFPTEVWDEAAQEWMNLDADAQDARLDEYNSQNASVPNEIKMQAFKDSFGLRDLLFFGIAIFVAFPAGAGMRNE